VRRRWASGHLVDCHRLISPRLHLPVLVGRVPRNMRIFGKRLAFSNPLGPLDNLLNHVAGRPPPSLILIGISARSTGEWLIDLGPLRLRHGDQLPSKTKFGP
jgi:hypothetical protein